MAIYKVKNQWGGVNAPWNDGGLWILGCRPDQNLIQLNIESTDNGKTFSGTMIYEGEGEIGLRATLIGGNNYSVENQWGGSTAPWNSGGNWIIGSRTNQRAIALHIMSTDGNHFTGTMTYDNEGPIGFEAAKDTGTSYTVENQWGGQDAPWNLAGSFILGTRANQNPVAFDLSSNNDGKTLTGTMTYLGEGPIGFKAELVGANLYETQNQWGGDDAPWHDGGQMIIGTRDDQNVIALNISSADDGATFTGEMTYKNEGAIGFKAKLSEC